VILAGGVTQDSSSKATVGIENRVWLMSPERADQMIRGDEGVDWGIALRIELDSLI
jgi:hypothetical protein